MASTYALFDKVVSIAIFMIMPSLSPQATTPNTANSILNVSAKKALPFKIKLLLVAKQKGLSNPDNDVYIYVRGYN